MSQFLNTRLVTTKSSGPAHTVKNRSFNLFFGIKTSFSVYFENPLGFLDCQVHMSRPEKQWTETVKKQRQNS
jgi:hypothetical protein